MYDIMMSMMSTAVGAGIHTGLHADRSFYLHERSGPRVTHSISGIEKKEETCHKMMMQIILSLFMVIEFYPINCRSADLVAKKL